MSSPATLTVGHVRALVAVLFPADLTPSGRAVFLVACHTAELAHAERQRPSFMQRLGVTADELDEYSKADDMEHPARRMPDAVGFLGPLA